MREQLAALDAEFWRWRAATRPDTTDDLPRTERPSGWRADWSSAAVVQRRCAVESFGARLAAIDATNFSRAGLVDARLLRSALDRVRWELDVQRGWQRNPGFYVDQAVVPVVETLLPPVTFGRESADDLVARLEDVPTVLEHGRGNLTQDAAEPLARLAIDTAARLGAALGGALRAVAPHLPDRYRAGLPTLVGAAVQALDRYRRWVLERLPDFTGSAAVGADGLAFFLHRIALYPHTADDLVVLARAEWHRAVCDQAALDRRPRQPPSPVLDLAGIVAAADTGERRLRAWYDRAGILGQPPTLRRYRLAPMPDHLAALSWYLVPDDLTSERRVDVDAIRWVAAPDANATYFERVSATDPLVGKLAHEGVHAQQLALSWRHPNPARRHYYDSAPNEGIACYHEEMALTAGLFDERPHAARHLVSFRRLRALRAELDVGVATGAIALDEAAARLVERVPLDERSARHDVAALAATPGQQLSYLSGKQQVLDLLATASLHFGAAFDLRRFHDRLWREGNVPLVLQRWELLGDLAQLEAADRLAAASGRARSQAS